MKDAKTTDVSENPRTVPLVTDRSVTEEDILLRTLHRLAATNQQLVEVYAATVTRLETRNTKRWAIAVNIAGADKWAKPSDLTGTGSNPIPPTTTT